MAEIKDQNYQPKEKTQRAVATAKLKEKTFGQKVKDAFISDEVHDVKSYIVFDVIIPAVKETIRSLIVNTVDMSLFGKVRSSSKTEQRGGSTYIAYERAYGNSQNVPKQSKVSGAPLRVNELERVTFRDKNDAIEVLSYLFDNIEEYHVASVADFLGAADLGISPIHHKWGWYDLSGASIEENPEDGTYWIKLPRPVAI